MSSRMPHAAKAARIIRLSAHDCRRTCARLCHAAGGELEQIQFLLGHKSVETTERYLGCKQRLRLAVNDGIGLERRSGTFPQTPLMVNWSAASPAYGPQCYDFVMSLQLAAKRPVLAAVGLVLIVLIYVAYLLFAPDAIRYSGEIRRGNQFVAEIEAYRRAKGRLPISVKDLGGAERESDRLFYQSCGGTHYIVWFGTVLGESMTYDSAKRRWESTNGTCQ